jgi:CRISPR-associated protein Csm3
MRSVLVRKYCPESAKPDKDTDGIKRLFGSMKAPSRLIFNDMILANKKELEAMDISSMTEVKFENSINRLTSVANPRQIERVIPGAKFLAEIVYTIDDSMSAAEIAEDMSLFAEGIKLLKYDYIGGHGSRGYGRISISPVKAECVAGDGEDAAEEAERIFEEMGI